MKKTIEKIQEELQQHYEKKNNILIPKGTDITPEELFEARMETVYISTDSDDEESYFAKESGKYRLNSRALIKLGNAGRISWEPDKSGIVTLKNPLHKGYKATGKIRGADGSWTVASAYADIDLEGRLKELQNKYKNEKDKYKIDRDYIKERKFALKKCETAAKGRVIRTLFPEIKSQYKKERLEKPFVLIWYTPSIDYSDPVIKKIAIAATLQNTFNIYGSGPSQSKQLPEPEFIEAEFADITHKNDDNIIPENSNDSENKMTNMEADFKSLTTKERVEMILELMERKNFIDSRFTRESITAFSNEHILNFFNKLQDMTDKKETDISFC